MFAFDRISIFHIHQQYLHEILGRESVFFVGGCVRDVLLGITEKPADIDLTMAGKPDEIRDSMNFDTEQMSRFKTDKFGTMTLIPKKPSQDLWKQKISYEITPFRTEGGYEDFRHPGEINRSDDLLLDSRRRDFTINCLYLCALTMEGNIVEPTTQPILLSPGQSSQELMQIIQKHPLIFLSDSHTLLIQDAETIAKVCAKGEIHKDILPSVIAKASLLHTTSWAQSSTKKLCVVIDPHGGLVDLLSGKLRTVWNPDDRFTEDALRIIRALRFPNTLNQISPSISFDYEKATRISMQHNAHLVKNLAKERINQEFVKVFKANNPFGYVSLLNELWLVEVLLPALAACKGDVQPIRYHPFDTFDHTLLTLHACQEINKNYLVKLAMLYHDVGKPSQYAYLREQLEKNPEEMDMSGYIHHTESSVPLAQQDLQNLGFSNKEIEEICRYIRRHHRPWEILASNPDQRAKKIRSLISEVGEKRVLNLIDLAIADRLGQFNPMQPPAIEELKEMKKIVKQMHKDEGRFTMKQLAVDWNILMKELSIPPGPKLGELLHVAFERVLTDTQTRNTQEKILVHLKSLNVVN